MNKSSIKHDLPCIACGSLVQVKKNVSKSNVRCSGCKNKKLILCRKCNTVNTSTYKNGNGASICDKCISEYDVTQFSSLSGRTISKIFDRAKLSCGNCGWNECGCDVHHIIHSSDAGCDELYNLCYLCPNCHRKAHRGLISSQRLMEISLKDFNWRIYYNCRQNWKKIVESYNNGEITISEICDDSGRTGSSVARRLRKSGADVDFSTERKRKFEVSKEELETLVKEKPMTLIGKIFGVSDNAVKKRCKKLGIELGSMRGYWQKTEAGKLEHFNK